VLGAAAGLGKGRGASEEWRAERSELGFDSTLAQWVWAVHGQHAEVGAARGARSETCWHGQDVATRGWDGVYSGMHAGGDSPSGLGYLPCQDCLFKRTGPINTFLFIPIFFQFTFKCSEFKKYKPQSSMCPKFSTLCMVADNFKWNIVPFWSIFVTP
jgi:hypothetical protein